MTVDLRSRLSKFNHGLHGLQRNDEARMTNDEGMTNVE